PDFGALARFMDEGAAVFARDGDRWKLRVFVPALALVVDTAHRARPGTLGRSEDPATASASGPLALHLARHGRIAFGDEIVIGQGVEIGRPSTLHAVARSPQYTQVGRAACVRPPRHSARPAPRASSPAASSGCEAGRRHGRLVYGEDDGLAPARRVA